MSYPLFVSQNGPYTKDGRNPCSFLAPDCGISQFTVIKNATVPDTTKAIESPN